MQTLKQKKRMGAKDRLEAQLLSGVKATKEGPLPLTEGDKVRIEKELKILQDRLAGRKKGGKVTVAGKPEAPKDKYFLDLFYQRE